MSQEYFAILTAIGEAKDAAAKAGGAPLRLTHMVVGDGAGATPRPEPTQTQLVREVYRAQLNQLSLDPINTSQVIAECVIPEMSGGWWIREVGLLDADGDLVAVANCPPSYKPQMPEGSARTQVIRMVLIVSSAETVLLSIDPGIVMATRQFAENTVSNKFDELASGLLTVGVRQVGDGFVMRDLREKLGDIQNVLDRGAFGDGQHDDLGAVVLSLHHSRHIYFPRRDNKPTTYFLGPVIEGTLAGAIISADTGVTLSFAQNGPYELYKSITFETDVAVHFRDVVATFVFPKTKVAKKHHPMVSSVTATERKRTALDARERLQVMGRSVQWNTGDEFTDAAFTSTEDTMTFAPGSQTFKGPFIGIGPYETVSAYFDNGVSPGPIGVIIRGTYGYSIIYSVGGAASYSASIKKIGTPISEIDSIPWEGLGQGRYNSFHPENSVWSVTRTSRNQACVKLNGKALTNPFAPYCGDILEVGFVCFTGSAFTVSGFTVERRTDAIIGGQELSEIRIFGDSTAEDFPGSFSTLLKPMLDATFGVKVRAVKNFAVSGTDISYACNSMKQNGFGNAYHVLIVAGTNNVQGSTPLDQFKAIANEMFDLVNAEGRRAIVVLPWLWYTREQTGGVGQASGNYERGAPYRMALERIAYAKGAVVIRTAEELPNPDPKYLLSATDAALLRDNIHQDDFAHELYAKAISQGMIDDYFSLPGAVETSLPLEVFKNGATPANDFLFSIDKQGLASFSGTIATPVVENQTVVCKLPRWLRPSRSVNFPAQALAAGGGQMLGNCYLVYDAPSGELRLILAPANTGVVIINAAPYKLA